MLSLRNALPNGLTVSMSEENSVLVAEHEGAGGLVVGHAQLNVEVTLNALSLAMIRLLEAALRDWAAREEVVAVVITAAGDKAFCAGGDVQALYRAIDANHTAAEVVDDYPFRFFEEEYRLDFLIHTYPKPLLTLGHGIVMGGGLGILCASQFRVLTDRSRLAVPEITIGLFPDAGASWTLGKMQPHHASYLALSGSHVNAADSLVTGMGTHVIGHDSRAPWLQDLLQLPWSSERRANETLLSTWLEEGAGLTLADSELVNVPEREVDFLDLPGEVAALYELQGTSKWIDRGVGNLRNGCPTTAGIIVEQLHRVGAMSLADSFRMELTVATHCAQNTDFREGVRALLIDKDNTPDWAFGSIDALPRDHVLSHFVPPWDQHPLADLAG